MYSALRIEMRYIRIYIITIIILLVEQQPTDFLEKSHISSKIYSTSEGSCEVQI